jgi:hypothetical protein
MHARRIRVTGCRLRGSLLLTVVLIAGLAVAGCGSPAKATGPVQCGTSRTPANTPVDIEVTSGHVACSTALTVEHDYTEAILDGKATLNGGGGAVQVDGWTCQGFATPVVLRTGRTSKCVKGSVELLAILQSSSS